MMAVIQDQVPIREFLKLPMLIVHFHEHQLSNRNISFSEFLSMHYAQEDDHDNDRFKDKQLPFKHLHTSNGVVSYIPSTWKFEFKQKLYDLGKKVKAQEYLLFIPYYLSGKIWQPPK
ncbi:hypothetical protein DBR11_24920 [Pedobacter sp. HMWF019]|uniref:hypothetical protein n=1 Tax=Pedobacter sp. HMWF019 TaxID=2056856 RepID=UPI000D3972DB|nr:hypothetical protein [Pedobacter sp. HMWF019]PTS93589.1 hypothetical protein DBR11_24920 [Pedobacter sp. HMWF019]